MAAIRNIPKMARGSIGLRRLLPRELPHLGANFIPDAPEHFHLLLAVVPLEDAPEVARLSMDVVARERKRLAEIEAGLLVRPEIDEGLRRAGVVE